MSDNNSNSVEQNHYGLESLSAYRSGSAQKSDKYAASSRAGSLSKEYSAHSAVKPQSKSKLRSPHNPTQSGFRSRSKSHLRSRHMRSRPRSRSLQHSRSLRSRRHSYRDYLRRYGYNYSPPPPPRHQWASRFNPEPNSCLGVFGLSLSTTERDLRDVFVRYGPISDVSVVYDHHSRRSRGFAFVYFENVNDAKDAKETADGIELDGRKIRVDFSITKRPHTPTPGVYMGRPTYGRHIDYYGAYDRRYSDWAYYSRFYRGCGVVSAGRGGGWKNGQDSYFYRKRSPSPYHSRGRYRYRYRSRSRSRSRPRSRSRSRPRSRSRSRPRSCSRSRPYSHRF